VKNRRKAKGSQKPFYTSTKDAAATPSSSELQRPEECPVRYEENRHIDADTNVAATEGFLDESEMYEKYFLIYLNAFRAIHVTNLLFVSVPDRSLPIPLYRKQILT
jgi:hypothetical protein